MGDGSVDWDEINADRTMAYEEGVLDGAAALGGLIGMAEAIRRRRTKCPACRCMILIASSRCPCCAEPALDDEEPFL